MEGVIQYRLLGNHPAASGRYLTVSFAGESTTPEKFIEKIVQEHRINTSRYKLELCRLVPARDTSGTASASLLPESSSSSFAGGGGTSTPLHALVPVAVEANDLLNTYDRLTVTVSTRDLADEENARKEKERLERQQRLREVEEQLLHSSSIHDVTVKRTPATRPGGRSRHSASASASRARTADTDDLQLQRAAALASQLFPIREGQRSTLTSVHDPDNTHQCVLCRLSAFGEELTPCCRFCVCGRCYRSAAEMVMEEGQCPVCGVVMRSSSAVPDGTGTMQSSWENTSEDVAGDLRSRGKRERVDEADAPREWKEEMEEVEKKLQRQRAMALCSSRASSFPQYGNGGGGGGGGESGFDSVHPSGPASPADGRSTAAPPFSSSPPSAFPASRGGFTAAGRHCGGRGAEDDVTSLSTQLDSPHMEELLRKDLDQVLSMLDAPDPLSEMVKSKRVMSNELLTLSSHV